MVDEIADRAPGMTTGQLAAVIRKLCVESDPEEAKKRVEYSLAERRVVIEPTADGTGHVFLLDIDIADAKAIGKRVNAHMISLRRERDDGPTTTCEPTYSVISFSAPTPVSGGEASST